MDFGVFGPFVIPVVDDDGYALDLRALRGFFETRRMARHAAGRGCYAFGLRRGGGIVPVHVARTRRGTFADECFSAPNRAVLEGVLGELGTPVLFLVQAQGRPGERALVQLEDYLLAVAVENRPLDTAELQVRRQPVWVIEGMGRGRTPGHPRKDVELFAKMLRIDAARRG